MAEKTGASEGRLPTDLMYEGGEDFGDVLFGEVAERTKALSSDIDWGQALDVSDEELDATTFVATQFHYAKMSHLLLCGEIIRSSDHQASVEAKQLAGLLSAYKIEGVDVWGRYIGKTAGDSPIAPEMKKYYRSMFSEDDLLTLFIAMETLGVVAYAIYEALHGVGDPLFNQITDSMREQKEKEMELVIEYLAPEIAERDETEQQELARTAIAYSNMAEKILLSQEEAFMTLDVSVLEVRETVLDETNTFYEEIGLGL